MSRGDSDEAQQDEAFWAQEPETLNLWEAVGACQWANLRQMTSIAQQLSSAKQVGAVLWPEEATRSSLLAVFNTPLCERPDRKRKKGEQRTEGVLREVAEAKGAADKVARKAARKAARKEARRLERRKLKNGEIRDSAVASQ